MSKKHRPVALYLNILIGILEVIGLPIAIREVGTNLFTFYTEDSNLLMLFTSLCYCVWFIRRKGEQPPRFLRILKLVSTLSVATTLIVVITILSWMTELSLWTLLTYGSMLYHHTLCPLLALISFVLFEPYDYHQGETLWGIAFTVVYAAIMIPLNILQIVNGPYPFLRVHEQPFLASVFWVALILGGDLLLSWLLIRFNRRLAK